MRTTAQMHRVVVRIKEAVLFRLILLFFIISLSACTANKEKGNFSFFKLLHTQQDEWLNLIPTDELKSINGQNRSDINNHETTMMIVLNNCEKKHRNCLTMSSKALSCS